MKAFHTIAIPHKDILEGRLTMDVFAADLWEVSQRRGPDEYKDASTFFNKTYLTQGLENILTIVEKRLQGKGGDPVIQLHTPFGGGKTHSLIGMYHKSSEWKTRPVTIVGTALGKDVTLWGLLEKQLTGKIKKFSDQVSPGREAIRELLAAHQPVLILMDEVLEYATKAAAVTVGQSNLAAQTIAFMQELTETISTLEQVCLVITLPSSIIEHYDEGAERLFQQLQKVAGRIEKIYTPVQEHEITRIIRRRLFSDINQTEVKKVVTAFVDYAEKEGVLPAATQPSEYRERFLDSYPFLPEVVDVLYHKWGSFPTFQRTRGVLRLLSLVIHSLKGTHTPYISLADFNLSIQEIKQELLKHIGAEFNSVIAQDISDHSAGSKRVDDSLGNAYRGLKLGSRTATTIFMYSFSGGQEHGATSGEIKRAATTLGNPPSVISEAMEQLKSKLFFLQSPGDKYYFGNQPNLNRILLTRMENIKDEDLLVLEKELIKGNLEGVKFRSYIWEENSGNIIDSEDLKLVILHQEQAKVVQHIITTRGQTPRVNRNTVIFLYPLEAERPGFYNRLKRKLAYEMILKDSTLKLTDEQKKEVRSELNLANNELNESVRRLYRNVAIPGRTELKTIDLGIPTHGIKKGIDREVYDTLRTDGEILENIAPIVIREKYLTGKEFVSTEQMYQASMKTPGETRFANRHILEKGISEGVQRGLFGLGDLGNDNQPVCRYFKELCPLAFVGSEVLIIESICIEQKQKMEESKSSVEFSASESQGTRSTIGEKGPASAEQNLQGKQHTQLELDFRIPKGKVSGIMGIMNLLQSKFETIEIHLKAKDGSISEQDIEDKIMETFRQLGIK